MDSWVMGFDEGPTGRASTQGAQRRVMGQVGSALEVSANEKRLVSVRLGAPGLLGVRARRDPFP